MAIPVEHEDVEELKGWGLGLENAVECCVFCGTGTRYWHLATNNPVCQCCAGVKAESDLPAAVQVK